MRRQYYRLSPKDEIELFKNRLTLSEYYDTLRSYLKVPTNLESLFVDLKVILIEFIISNLKEH